MKRLLLGTSRRFSSVTWLAVIALVGSCNLYSPFEGGGSDLDHLELGRRALKNKDFDGAIAEFEQMSDGQARRQQLCEAQMSKAGLTISILVNTLVSGSAFALGNVASQLLPWTQGKEDATNAAITQCEAYFNNAAPTEVDLGVLLRTLAHFSHCSTLMAKTDQYQTTDDTTCTTTDAANRGRLIQSSIATAVSGVASPGNPAMCKADAQACLADFLALDPASLGNSKLGDLQGVYNGLPPDLKNSASTPDKIRIALKNTITATN